MSRFRVAGPPAILLWWVAVGPVGGQELAYQRTEVAPGIHLFRASDPGAGNVVAVVSGAEAMVVDATASPASAHQVAEDLGDLGVQRVTYLVNSHWHHDHVLGNQSFQRQHPDLRIVAHRETGAAYESQAIPDLAAQIGQVRTLLADRDSVLATGVDDEGVALTDARRAALEARQTLFRELLAGMEEVEATPPELLFEDRVVLTVGAREVHLVHLGPGHSSGDIVAWVLDSRTLIAGDLVTLPFPAAAPGFSSVEGWVAALDRLSSFEFDVLIPGHGGVQQDDAYLRAMTDLFDTIVDQVGDAVARGVAQDEAMRVIEVSKFRDEWVPTGAEEAFLAFFVRPAVAILYEELNSGSH